MKLFTCRVCGNLLYFENVTCLQCGARLGFDRRTNELLPVVASADGGFTATGSEQPLYFCTNAERGACNWLTARPGEFCIACRLNTTIPNLSDPANAERWRDIERAKHRLVYSLLRLGLPVRPVAEDPEHGLSFEFLAPAEGETVLTGHADGRITLNILEADPAERERRRIDMAETYRTLLGHFRHEVGHYYWDLLVKPAPDAFRALFGDDRADYGEALKRHHANGAPANWQDRFVSAYASTHPWEDFAETFAHYLHIVDTLETAYAFGLDVHPRAPQAPAAEVAFDPYVEPAFEPLIAAWMPLTYAVNALNRSMGQPDLYPFVLSTPVLDKLGFVHGLVRGARGAPSA